MNCPKCQSTQTIKYGHTHYGKPRFRCQSCGRQFALECEPLKEHLVRSGRTRKANIIGCLKPTW